VPYLSAKPTEIVCHDVETSRQRALGLGKRSFAQAGDNPLFPWPLTSACPLIAKSASFLLELLRRN
jgi:hypothetical protein